MSRVACGRTGHARSVSMRLVLLLLSASSAWGRSGRQDRARTPTACVPGSECNYTMATALRMTLRDYDAACEALKRRPREGPDIDQIFLDGPRVLSPPRPGSNNGLKFIHIPKTGGGTVEEASAPINFRAFHTSTLDATIALKSIEKQSQNLVKSIKKACSFRC